MLQTIINKIIAFFMSLTSAFGGSSLPPNTLPTPPDRGGVVSTSQLIPLPNQNSTTTPRSQSNVDKGQANRNPLFNKINSYRAQNGKRMWARNHKLDKQAQLWAEQLAREKGFYHMPNSNSWENIGFISDHPAYTDIAHHALQGWIESPGHNANLLETEARSGGVGIARGYLPGRGWGYFCVMQASR